MDKHVAKDPAPTAARVGAVTGHQFAMVAGQPVLWPDFLKGQPARPVRVLLVEDDAHMRRVIAQDLLADERVSLVAQGASSREGRRLAALHEFDVLLVDLNLGDGTGFDLIQHVKSLRPFAEAIVITASDDEQHALQAFALGATGYLVKNSWFGNFPQAVLQVVNGGASITPGLARRLLRQFESASAPRGKSPVGLDKESLSDRERVVLRLVAAGHTSPEVGTRLSISPQTVNTHVKNIYRKLQVRSRAQAVSTATHRGWL
ncbi:MAG: hypothetical protein RIS90_2549 [Pseudomonadota bacterium]|jgi:DNA-binding NarL/FixJ family response regulator